MGLDSSQLNRRSVLRTTLAAAGAGRSRRHGARHGGPASRPGRRVIRARARPRRYRMKKSINLWAFPYPQRMTPSRMSATRQGRRVRRHRAQLRPGKRPLAQVVRRPVPRDPQDGRGDRHRDQRPLLVPVLALFAHRQRPRAPRAWLGAGRPDDRGRPRAGDRKPADDRRLDLHPLASRPRAGADRRLRPPRPRVDRPAAARSPRSTASTSTSRTSSSTAI